MKNYLVIFCLLWPSLGLTLDLQWQQGNIYYPLNVALNETKLSSNKSLTPYDVLASLGKINKAQKKSKKSKKKSKKMKESFKTFGRDAKKGGNMWWNVPSSSQFYINNNNVENPPNNEESQNQN